MHDHYSTIYNNFISDVGSEIIDRNQILNLYQNLLFSKTVSPVPSLYMRLV